MQSLSEGVQNDPRKLAATLVNSKILTSWQARRLLGGKGAGFYVGRYKLLDLLGSGGMGRVYLAEHLKMHQLVAIKILRPVKGKSKVAEKEIVARFAREAQAIAALSHPNIVQAFDFDEVGSLRYLVMEFVEGANASAQLMKTGPLPYEQVADYICQAAAGLKHAHDAGLVHRDVKPANILIDKSGHVKLVDLGLVSCLPDATDDGLTVDEYKLGTVDFIAPEQALSSHDVDPRADIYALGGSFYRLISGKLLFPGLNTTQKLLAQQTKQPTPISELVPDLPSPIVEAINKMLAKDRNDRYADVMEIVDVLQPFAKRIAPPYAVDIIPQTREQIEPFLRRGPASLSKTSIKAPEESLPAAQHSAPDLVPADSVVFANSKQHTESSMTTMQAEATKPEPDKKPSRGLIIGAAVATVAAVGIAVGMFFTGDDDQPVQTAGGGVPPQPVAQQTPDVEPEPTPPKPAPEKSQVVAVAKPVVPPSPPARKPSTKLPMVLNAGFEVDVDGDGWPDKWPVSKTLGVSWVLEDNNHFVRLDCVTPGEVSAMYKAMPVPAGAKELEVSWRQRITGLELGQRDWFDARLTIGFMDEDNTDFPLITPPNTKESTNGWEQQTMKVAVPEGAAKFKVRPCLNQVQAGRFEVDDLIVNAFVNKPEMQPSANEAQVDSGAFIAGVMPKPTQDSTGDGHVNNSDEYVLIINTTNQPIDLTGFELSNSKGLLHVLPVNTRLWPEGTLRIFTGELNANQQAAKHGAWNDDADRIILSNPVGQRVAEQLYLSANAGEEVVFSPSSDTQ